MKQKSKLCLACLLILAAMAVLTACAADQTAYEKNNADGYTVSVKFDANGGVFTTNVSVIVDAYRLEDLPRDANGNAQVALLEPNDPARGNDAFDASYSGCFLVGWYQTRTETVNENGETVYTYADPWDFETDTLTVDPNGTYSSQEPELTLYAAWAPMLEYVFYSVQDGSCLGTYSFEYSKMEDLKLPQWNTETGTLDMYRFPKVNGATYTGVYYDPECLEPVTGDSLTHPATINIANGTVENSVLDLYVDYMDGEWYRIYIAEQFISNANVMGCYEICADLDFTDLIWPTSFLYGSFTGTIHGNGYTMSNISAVQTNNSKTNAGLFGTLKEDAQITDLTLDNVCFTIQSGIAKQGTNYGLFAGTISEGAKIDGVRVVNSVLYIDSGCSFLVTDYAIGLVCGLGNSDVLEEAQITCEIIGSDPDRFSVTVDEDGMVELIFE